jgi:hypothetical protein
MALVRVGCPSLRTSRVAIGVVGRAVSRTLGGRRIYCARRVGHLIRSATDWVFQPRVTHSPPRSLASTRQVFLLPTGGGWRGDRDPQLPLASRVAAPLLVNSKGRAAWLRNPSRRSRALGTSIVRGGMVTAGGC